MFSFVKRPLILSLGLLLGGMGMVGTMTQADDTPNAGFVQPQYQPGFQSISPIAGQDVPPPPPGGAEQAPPPAVDPMAVAAEAPAGEAEDEMWSLTSVFDNNQGGNFLADNGWKLGGNTVQSFTFNFSSPSDRFNGPVTWTDRSNAYQLNQQWLYLEKATNTTEKDFDLGGRMDFLYGTNARFTTESGLEDNFNRQYPFYGVALPQFYVEAAYKSVKVKAGHFISPVGFFTVDMTQNFFNTIPYTYQYGEPFTHTGALATWTVDDHLTVGSGITRGWDNFGATGNGSPNLGWMGTATYTWEDKSSIAWVGMWSREFTGAAGQYSGRYFQTLVYTRPIGEKWTYVAQSDFGTQGTTVNASPNGAGTSRWYGLNQYLFYQHNQCWAWGGNLEWFRDEEGFRVGGFLPNPPAVAGENPRGLSTARSGFAGNFYQITVGPKWTPNKNLMIRPNLRFDWYGDDANAAGLLPYGDGTKRSQVIFGTDMAILY